MSVFELATQWSEAHSARYRWTTAPAVTLQEPSGLCVVVVIQSMNNDQVKKADLLQ